MELRSPLATTLKTQCISTKVSSRGDSNPNPSMLALTVPGKLMSFRQRNKVFLRRAQQIEAILIAAVALEGWAKPCPTD
jgi:hypothetical protein